MTTFERELAELEQMEIRVGRDRKGNYIRWNKPPRSKALLWIVVIWAVAVVCAYGILLRIAK